MKAAAIRQATDGAGVKSAGENAGAFLQCVSKAGRDPATVWGKAASTEAKPPDTSAWDPLEAMTLAAEALRRRFISRDLASVWGRGHSSSLIEGWETRLRCLVEAAAFRSSNFVSRAGNSNWNQIKQYWKSMRDQLLEVNHSKNCGVSLFFPTDTHPLPLSDLLQNHMSTKDHMHKVCDKSDKV